MPAVLSGKKQSHPDLYDRMLAAGVTPDYEWTETTLDEVRERLGLPKKVW